MTTPTDAQILDIAGRFYRGAGAREQAMRDELDLSATRFAQLLVGIVNDPSPEVAVAYGPLLNRLRRRQAAGIRARTARRAG
jgi:hypothetical protein